MAFKVLRRAIDFLKRLRESKPSPGPGRPFLDGSPPGAGTRTAIKCVSLPPEMAEYLRRVGGGNLSKGVRVVTECHRLRSDE